MRVIKTTIEIDEQPGVFHIPGTISQGGAATLCAWVDVPHQEHDIADYPINCNSCLGILREVKNMRLPT